ncbi:MAG: hypothetical protein ACSLFE_00665 [Gemmatimonadaceae bacterium]
MKPAFTVLVAALFFSSPVAAQMAGLEAGARVRVTSPPDDLSKHVTTVREIRPDSIVVESRSGLRTVAVDNITALDVSTGKRGHMLRDGAIGLGIGALLGGVLVKSASDDCPGGGEYGVCGAPVLEAEATALGVMVFGSVGLLAGAAIGAFWDRSDRWERRNLPFRAAIGASRLGGISLNFSRAF